MVFVVETASRLVLTGSREEMEKLSLAYRIRPSEYWRSPKWELYKRTKGEKGWDGYIYPFKARGTTGVLARGHLDDLKIKADLCNIVLDLSRTLKRPYANMVPDDVPTDLVVSPYPDYPHQREIVFQWLRTCMGIGEITVSGGKTRAFCMVASMLKRKLKKMRVLYLVPTERLVKQAYNDAKGFLPEWSITQYGGDSREKNGNDVVVATYAIIGKNFVELYDWLRTFNVLCVDEAHHASSPTLSKIIESVPAYFKFGATDSAKEDDPIRGVMIRGLLGPVLAKMEAGGLIAEGNLAKPTIYVVDDPTWQNLFEHLPHQALPDTPAWVYMAEQWRQGIYKGPAVERDQFGVPKLDKKDKTIQIMSTHRLDVEGLELDVESRWCLLERTYDRAIIRFKKRNELIYQWADYFSKGEERTLIVATRTLHVLILQAGLEKVVDPKLVRTLFSENDTKERDETFEWLKETPGCILVSPLVKEGVSLPELTAGIVADYVGTEDVANQLVGRLIRKKRHRQENTAKVVWFIDRQVPSFRKGSLEVVRKLEQIRGYSFYHPVTTPESVDLALHYESSS